MNESFPDQPPLPQGSTASFHPVGGAPATVNVFGILHLVFAGIGLITAAWAMFIVIAGNPFLNLGETSPELKAQLQAQLAMQEKVNPMSLATSILSILVAIPMIIAGVQLLRKRKNGLKWSNAYVWSSIGAKLVNLVLTITILVPAMKEMTRGILDNSRTPDSFSGIMSGFMAGGAIGGVIISCAYPLTALILLNRPATKAWFASLPR
ncbi:MAG: hypothetical protein V4584_02175 [Verrucomicrobiota bacterium]